MKKVNTHQLEEITWNSPSGKFGGAGKQVSEALGRKPASTDLIEQHPFDVEILRIESGKSAYPYHSHSAQWEFYHVISGKGVARDDQGNHMIQDGDAFLYKPGEAHQLSNDGIEDLIVYVVADNPVGETCYYPDSKKWMVHSPENKIIRSDGLPYYDGEDSA